MNLFDYLVYMVEYTNAHETMDPIELGLKAQEEMGEWAEAVLNEHGVLRHKDIETCMYDELADTFMVMLTATAKMDKACGHTVLTKLQAALERKFKKYTKILESQE